MAIYEYKCQKCSKVTTLFEKAQDKDGLFVRLKRRCTNCGSRKLSRIFSNFTAIKQESSADMLNEMSRLGPVNFVPDYRPKGPPPGGCPYAKEEGASDPPI
ncbi:MAG: zinc ribbon domain-containing protein [Candidatus Omnitrophota bacterium]|jgi:putative FmdB family regulatory protein